MATKPYEAPDLVMVGGGDTGDDGTDGSNQGPFTPNELSFPVWKDIMGRSNASFDDYVAWMNGHGYGAYIQDEKY